MNKGVRLVNTGIPGMDKVLKGGLPEKSITLVSGPPGIGKTNMGLQYIHNGATEYGEPGIYMTVEYSRGEVKKYCRNFDWDLDGLEKENKLVILEQPLLPPDKEGAERETLIDVAKRMGEKKETLIDVAKRIGAKRFTLDSITMFHYLHNDIDVRRFEILKFMASLKNLGLTTLIISEQEGIWPNIEVDSTHFLADGLIHMFWSTQREMGERCIRVSKMRGQEIDTTIRPFNISDKGCDVNSAGIPFTLREV